MSHNPDYRPNPPQVGSQQFNNYGSQPQNGSGQYSQGQANGQGQPYSQGQQYGQSQPFGQNQPYGQGGGYGQGGYSQPGASGWYGHQGSYGQSGAYSQPDAYAQQSAYSQQGSYSQPMTYGAQPMIVRPVANKMAVWSMWMGIGGVGGGFVCGVLSLVPFIGYLFSFIAMFLWIAPVLAIIFGHVGLSQIKRTGEEGRGQAIAGLIIGYVSIGLGLLSILIVIGIFGIGFLAMMGGH
ncbi:DUF4190 domain-containing protein [Brevibacterium atlanticum]|uniref:DUF4190 domain-containing protein n=1 Tax=Brevibacterium atlanticum TaxID=2697563 RepID=UPI001D181E51|nr:DUF4190 domain-containing protein [Brevibacterium atlanticum]